MICYTMIIFGEVNPLYCDCHIHIVLDGKDWRNAIARHEFHPDDTFIRATLARYQALGYTYLRDGGDRWGAGRRAWELAPEYNITYRTPLAPLYKAGHYGSFIGKKYENMGEFRKLVAEARQHGANFIKVMFSGLMDFDRAGVLTQDSLAPEEIQELIHIAHGEGFSVMAHANGARTVECAAAAGADSIEHGAYLDDAALSAMAENRTVWVPTLSTIGNLRGKGRFKEDAVQAIFHSAVENIRKFTACGGLIAPGSDAGAWAVPHGCHTEYDLLRETLGDSADTVLARGSAVIMDKF